MACSKSLQDTVGDVTECSICTESMINPRVLPCIHTFCFSCLDQLWREKKPGVEVLCPLCRSKVVIPVEGISGLPKNFFIEKLVDAQKFSKTGNTVVMCDICSTNDGNGTSESVSEMFCTECQQHMCKSCLKVHSSVNTSKAHHLSPTGKNSAATKELFHFPEPDCDSHQGQKIQIFCVECKVAVCAICFITQHNGHKCSDVKQVVEDLKKQIKSGIEETRKIVIEVNDQSKALDELSVNFEINVKEAQSRIVQTGEKMKKLIDKHVQALLQELEEEKTKKVKKFDVSKEELQVQKLSLESFIKYSEIILEKAVPADVASAAKDLSVRFESLKDTKIKQIGKSLEISFVPRNPQILSETDKSVVGKINLCGDIVLSNSGRSVSFDKSPILRTSIHLGDSVWGIAVVGKQIFVVTEKSGDVKVFDSSTLAPQSNIAVSGLVKPRNLVASGNVLFIGSLSGKVHRIDLRDKSVTSWSVGTGWTLVSINKHDNIIAAIRNENKLYEYTSSGNLQRTIKLNVDILELYCVKQLDNDQFLVCQSGQSLHRVCLLDGNIVKSFGSTSGSGNASLSTPFHFVVARNGFILVADYGNSRSVWLNKQLEYVRDIIPSSFGLSGCVALFLDEDNARLYASDYTSCKLAIFDFE